MSELSELRNRIDQALATIGKQQQRAKKTTTIVIFDGITGKPLPGYEERAQSNGTQIWLPEKDKLN